MIEIFTWSNKEFPRITYLCLGNDMPRSPSLVMDVRAFVEVGFVRGTYDRRGAITHKSEVPTKRVTAFSQSRRGKGT